jgi:hypothetical protein
MPSVQTSYITTPKLQTSDFSEYTLRIMDSGAIHLVGPAALELMVATSGTLAPPVKPLLTSSDNP